MNIFGKKHSLDCEINSVLAKMKALDPSSKEYSIMTENLGKLYSAKKEGRTTFPWGAVITTVGSLVGVVAVIYSEETRIIAGKAFGLIPKGHV